MDLYSRYVLRQATNALVMILGSLTVIVWIATSLKQVENLSSGGFGLFFQMTSLAMPQAMAIVSPFALLIACLYSLNKLNQDSELIVMTASGATVWRLFRPYLVLGLVLSLLVLFSNVFVQPASMQKLRTFIIKVRADLIAHVLLPGKFSSPTGSLTFHIRDRAKNGDILGLLVNDERDEKQHLTYLAEVGELIKFEDRAYLKMSRGHIHRKAPEKPGVQIVKFDEYILDLSEFGQARKGPVRYKPKERYITELLNPSPRDRKSQKTLNSLNAELHNRFSSALYPLFFTFLAVAALGIARSNRRSSIKPLLFCFAIGLVARLLGLVALNMMKVNPQAVLMVYGIPLLGIAGCIFYIWLRMNPDYKGPGAALFKGKVRAG